MVKKIIYFSHTRLEHSLNSVRIKGLRENGVDVLGMHIKDRGPIGLFKALSFYQSNSKNTDAVMAGFDSPAIVIFLRFFCRKKIIYIAFRSTYEGMVISRKLASPLSIKATYYWLLDFVAVHLADLTVVESDNQAEYFKKIFKISGNKIFRNWIGVNEDMFYYDSSIPKTDVFTVLFRGALMPEAGVEYVIKTAKILEDKNIRFIIIGGGSNLEKTRQLIDKLKPANLEHMVDFIPYDKLRVIMQGSHLSLGQLSDHERLTRTIPHKAYESLAMKLPYLTASTKGILELLKAGETCISCEPADEQALAEKIIWARANPNELNRVAENGYKLYQNQLKSKILAKNLLDRMEQL